MTFPILKHFHITKCNPHKDTVRWIEQKRNHLQTLLKAISPSCDTARSQSRILIPRNEGSETWRGDI